jgi:hypothetical protein
MNFGYAVGSNTKLRKKGKNKRKTKASKKDKSKDVHRSQVPVSSAPARP